MKKAKFISIILVFCILIGGASLWLFAKPDGEISEWERRKLQQFPEITVERVMDGKFMKEFETYAQDQFPLRNKFRSLKANTRFRIFKQLDDKGLYCHNGSTARSIVRIFGSSV